MATDFGDAGGGSAWPEPPRPEWLPESGLAVSRRPRRARFLALALAVLSLTGLVVAGWGLMNQLMARTFTASQRQQITNWEYGKRWRALPAGRIFPATAAYPPPASLDDGALKLSVHRIGIAAQATCAAATDPAAAAVLDRDGCSALLRATYVDETDSYVVTVGVAVLPGETQAAAAAAALSGDTSASGRGPTVHPVPFKGTPAAWFTASRRQLSGVVSGGTYVVLYTVGYTDSRPAEPVSGDAYTDNEMTSAGRGAARSVLSVLAAPVPAPHCPGTAGC